MREVKCEICDEKVLASQMVAHKNECMMKEIISMRKVQKKLLKENTELKMAVTELMNEVRELSSSIFQFI